MNDNWEIDQTINNSDLYNVHMVDFPTLQIVMSHIKSRAKNYEKARDLEGHYHKAARYESMREAMEILYNDFQRLRDEMAR